MRWLMMAGMLARRVGQYLWQSRLTVLAVLCFWWLLIATTGAHGQFPAFWWLAFLAGCLFLGMAQGFAISDVRRAYKRGYSKGYSKGREVTAWLRSEAAREEALLEQGRATASASVDDDVSDDDGD